MEFRKGMTVSDIHKEGFKTRWNNKLKRIETKCDIDSKEFNKKECKIALNEIARDLDIPYYGGDD